MNLGGFQRVAVCVIAGATALTPCAALAKTHHYRFGQFHLTVNYDSFTGATKCLAKGHDIVLRDSIISFKFDPNIPTDRAQVRINAGSVINAAEYRTEIRSRQIFLETGPLPNPDASRVNLPVSLFADASFVDIRPNPDKRFVKHFKLSGLNSALSFMSEHGCKVEIE